MCQLSLGMRSLQDAALTDLEQATARDIWSDMVTGATAAVASERVYEQYISCTALAANNRSCTDWHLSSRLDAIWVLAL